MYMYTTMDSVIAGTSWVLVGTGVKIESFGKIQYISHLNLVYNCTLLPLESWVFNSLVVVFIPEWWLLPTTTDQCSYNTDHGLESD